MKRTALYILAVLGAGLAVSSCWDKFLEVDYYSIVNPDGVYEDANNVYMGLIGIYNGIYQGGAKTGNWPDVTISNYPSLDMQAEGWDSEMTTHSWKVEAKSGFFENLWNSSYKLISRANAYLAALEDVKDDVVPQETKKIYEGEARFLRGYCYYNLTTNFSRVPMLMTGETYANSPAKARPDSDEEAWKIIIEDLEYAASVLDWTPAEDMTGRATKASALAYAAKAHMYVGEYEKAKGLYKQIIDGSGRSMHPVQGMIYWPADPGNCETIWSVSYPEFPEMGWNIWSYALNGDFNHMPQHSKPDEYGGWGDSPVSYEFTRCFEPGDKRLSYNVIGWHEEWDEAQGKMVGHGDTNYYLKINVNIQGTGEVLTNPYVGATRDVYRQYFQTTRSCVPNNHAIKRWKTDDVYGAYTFHLYRYTGVLLDYAECCFRTGDDSTGWSVIKDIRNRAWGNLEVGYDPNANTTSTHIFPVELLNTETVEVPDAQTFYAQYKAEKGYTSDVWVVAVTQERRKELLHEHSFWYDLCRMDIVGEWLDCEYPKNGNATFYNTKTGKYYIPEGTDKNQPYVDAPESEKRYMVPVTQRDWDWNPIHRVYPIPTSELTANPLCTQNEGY